MLYDSTDYLCVLLKEIRKIYIQDYNGNVFPKAKEYGMKVYFSALKSVCKM